MDIFTQYKSLAFRVTGKWVEAYLLENSRSLQPQIQKANIKLTLLEYLSMAAMSSIAFFLFGTVFISMFVGLLTSVATGVLFGVLIGLVGSVAIFMGFYFYPSISVGERKKKIDDSLAFAILYLSTIASSGTSPVTMFRTLSKFKEYGEISEEAQRMVDEVDVMGINMPDALEKAAARTPSDKLKEIFWGLRSALITGGDLTSFLQEKSYSAMQDYRRRLNQFSQQLSMFIEMYITVVIVGSIFFMILSTIMGGISVGTPVLIVGIQLAVVFLFLPAASVGFVVLVRGIAPSST